MSILLFHDFETGLISGSKVQNPPKQEGFADFFENLTENHFGRQKS